MGIAGDMLASALIGLFKDKQKILDKCEIVSWLDKNQTAEKKEFEHQKKELENVCSPIII